VEVTACVATMAEFVWGMSVKEQLLNSFNDLPENATWEDAEERIRFLAAIDEARAQLDRGEGIPHEEVKRQMLSWFRK
jgi:hypothetical protein